MIHSAISRGSIPEVFWTIPRQDSGTQRRLAPKSRCKPVSNFTYSLSKPFNKLLTGIAVKAVALKDITALPRRFFPKLERLILCLEDRTEFENFDWIMNDEVKAFAHSPTLTHVALKRPFRNAETDHIQLPWKQLTHFVEGSLHTNSARYFLTTYLPMATQLRFLALTLSVADFDDYANRWCSFPSTTMPNLESLSIDSTVGGVIAGCPWFLTKFNFPNLRSLRLSGLGLDFESLDMVGANHPPAEVLLDKLRGFTRLQYLSLIFPGVLNGRTLKQILDATPHVTVLDTPVFLHFPKVLLALTGGFNAEADDTRPAQILLPRLQKLVLTVQSVEIGPLVIWRDRHPIEPDLLVPFARSRIGSNLETPLKKISLCNLHPEDVDEEDTLMEAVRTLREEGLEVEINMEDESRRGMRPECATFPRWVERDPDTKDWLSMFV